MAEEVMTTATETTATEAVNTQQGATPGENQNTQTEQPSALTMEAIERLVQSRVDKITADLGKKNSNLQKELDKIKKEKLSDEEIQKLELADRDKALTEREKTLQERENRLFAIKAIQEIGLNDGSQQSLDLVDFVMANDEEAITTRVKAFKSLVDRFVNAKVEQTFKANGRVPNGGGKANEETKDNNIAVVLGQRAAETAKKSNDILNYYLGGKK